MLDWVLVGIAVVAAAGAVAFLCIDALPDSAAVVLAVMSATATGLAAVRRWLVTDLFRRGYLCGWADRAREDASAPYPPGGTVRPLWSVKS